MKTFKVRWQLVCYDALILLGIDVFLLGLYRSYEELPLDAILQHTLLSLVCVLGVRVAGRVYQQIWRYGGIESYIRLLMVDAVAFVLNFTVTRVLSRTCGMRSITFSRLLSIICINLLATLAIRMIYRYAYKNANRQTVHGRFLCLLLRLFGGTKIEHTVQKDFLKTKIAIVGAGRIGATLAEELLANESSIYMPRCFVDANVEKVGRNIHGIPVLMESDAVFAQLSSYDVQEVVFAIPNLDEEEKKRLYEKYLQAGYKIKVYDYPVMQKAGDKRYLREFDIDDLLFRTQVTMSDEKTASYYKGKRILITGGGGSIGSELCRQLAKMDPSEIVILDIYENGAYDVQQELKLLYGANLKLTIEICSVTNITGLARVFEAHHPQIVIHAAAHKHVPLMEHNCIEAVENNVFGTLNVVELCEEYKVERLIMVSTDKAVNPTNVMGATKRFCEMIVQCAGVNGKATYSATRFGNVLGSAGSVIPLFKKQIANGGPITITDKRIVRYFMTIPEASWLVLQSGAMAKNGELFVLDMGQPVKILDLAQNMIRLSGARGIDIIETGLRPGEKLYEELLLKTEGLETTENRMIFVEKDTPLSTEDLLRRLDMLRKACDSNDDETVRAVLKQVVPTYRAPETINATADQAKEMNAACRV